MKCWLLSLAILALVAHIQAYRVVCYYESWAVYRPGNGKFGVEDIDPSLCTHHIYSFVGVGTDGSVSIMDPGNDVDAFRRFTAMKNKNPGIKTMAAIGGWSEGSTKFSNVVNNDGTRAKFVNNIVAFVQKYGFDGFDVDWEYPTQRGGSYNDRVTFVKLLSELRAKFDQHGYVLSAAVAAGGGTSDAAYDIPGMSKYLDFINVMTYDFHGEWDSVTGENAPLYSSDSGNVDASINYWISKGAPKTKLNLGMGTYGRTFRLQSSSRNTIGSPVSGVGNAGKYTQGAGMLGYNEICENRWTEVWNDAQKVPYAYNGDQWVGYDNVRSVTMKAQYIKDKGLGGAMVWAIDTDDFRGTCGAGKYPLLHAMNSVLGRTGTNPTQPTSKPSTGTSAPPSGALCKKAGYVRDPKNCAVFYYCQEVNGQYQPLKYTCPEGTYFDASISACNYKNQVQC